MVSTRPATPSRFDRLAPELETPEQEGPEARETADTTVAAEPSQDAGPSQEATAPDAEGAEIDGPEAEEAEPEEDAQEDCPADGARAETDTAPAMEGAAPRRAEPAGNAHRSEPTAVPEPVLPRVAMPDLNAIRAPIVRNPPKSAKERAAEILKETGATPADHHAAVQASVFRVTEEARTAQRDMVRSLGTIASRTRWSIEDMAGEIDGVVKTCVSRVIGAAAKATSDIETAALANDGIMRGTRTAGEEEMQSRRADTLAEIVTHLQDNGSGKLRDVHARMVADFGVQGGIYAANVRTVASGTEPALVGPGTGAENEFKPPEDPVKASFGAEGRRLAGLLPTVPAGDSGAGGAQDTNYKAYVSEPQAGALIQAGPEQQAKWLEGITERTTQKVSAAARDAFYLAALGITAPAAEAMDEDEEEYDKTLNDTVVKNKRKMDHATYQALRQLHETLIGVRNFFDPANTNSMTHGAVKGLRDTGRQMREGLLGQARAIEANILASAAPFAAVYPDVIARLSETLEGDNLMDQRIMLPRVAGVSDTVRSLHQSHLDMLQDQSRRAVSESREGTDRQIAQLWKTTDKTLGRIVQFRAGSIAHFAVLEAQFTGDFTNANKAALAGVMRYADAAAHRLMLPVRAGEEAGGRVTQAIQDHFNRQLVIEFNQHARKVEEFREQVGFEKALDPSVIGGTKPLYKIHQTQRTKLENAAGKLLTALPPEIPPERIAMGVGVVAAGAAAAPFTGGTSAAVAAGVAGAMAYDVYSSMPSKSKAADALGTLSWPGPLAMNAIWFDLSLPAPRGRERVQDQADETGDADWEQLAQLFSASKQSNVDARVALAEDRGFLTGIDNDSAMKILQSLSDSERALISEEDRERLADSIRDNFFGLDEERALAYSDGNRGMALAIRYQEELDKARAAGDVEMDQFNQRVTRILLEETQASGYRGSSSPEAMQALENQMYMQLDQRLQHQAGQGPAPHAVVLPDDAQALFKTAATPNDPTQGQDAQEDQVADPGTALLNGMIAAQPTAPAEADLRAAKRRVLAHMTRDYATYDGAASVFTSGDDLGARQMADAALALGLEPQTDILGRQTLPGVVMRGMRDQTKRSLESLVMNGANQPITNQNQAANTLRTAGRSSVFGTTQAEFVNVLQQVEDPSFNLAKRRLEAVRTDPEATPTEFAEALGRFNAAERKRNTNLVAIARQLTGNPNGEMSIEEARETVAAEINRVAAAFHPALVVDDTNNAGRDIVENGRLDLRRGMDVATAGAGTYDELLMQVTGKRHKSETATITAEERRTLGIGGSWWGGETSGDQAQQLEINLDGVAETDVDRLRQASIRARHEAVDGTSYISGVTMRGSWQRGLMDDRHNALGERVQAAIEHYQETHPDQPLPEDFATMTPDQLVPLVGEPDPRISQFLLDDGNNLIGPGKSVTLLADESAGANRAYRDEIGRQEAFFTGLITAAVVVVSIVLLLVPGVNVAAAGVLTALLGGAATIAVKAGMRGNRYGWEEAAVDVGRTAIQAATAGVGAGMGGEVMAGTPAIGHLARAGAALESGLGKLGAAAAREAITGSINTVATKALDDRTWSKGAENGLSELFKAGAKGALTGVISGGVSEAVTKGMNGRLANALGDGADDAVGAAARRNVPDVANHQMMQEVLSGFTGSTLSEAASIAADIADGKAKFNFKDIAKKLGTAGLREVFQGAARSRVQIHYKRVYDTEMGKILRAGGDMSPAQAKFMRRLAISAGVERYGRAHFNDHAATTRGRYRFDSQTAFEDGIKAAARIYQGLPPSVRSRIDDMSVDDLARLDMVLRGGLAEMGAGAQELKVQLAAQYPGLDAAGILRDLDATFQDRTAEAERVAVADTATRDKLLSGMDPELRESLADLPVREIGALSPDGLMALKQAMLLGAGPDHTLHVMSRIAAGDPEVMNNPRLRREVETILAGHKGGKEDIATARATRRQDVGELLPRPLRKAVDSFTDAEIKALHVLVEGRDLPEAKRRELAGLIERRTGLDDGTGMLDAMISTGRAKAKTQADVKEAEARAARMEVMDHVAPELRPLLAHLPEYQLLQIALAQAGQLRLSRGAIRKMARSDAERKAILRTIRAPAGRQGGFFTRVAQRRAMLEFAPSGMRAAIRRTPILTLSDKMFAAYVKSLGGGREFAATLMIDGQPVVLIREGAPREALGEEGFHVVQARDPAFKARLTELNEEVLAAWPTLPVEEKVRLTRIALEAEIAAQLYLRDMLGERQGRSADDGARRRLGARADAISLRLETLQRRVAELGAMGAHDMRMMAAGRMPMPDWLARPARLFMEDDAGADAVPEQPDAARPEREGAGAAVLEERIKKVSKDWPEGWGTAKTAFEASITRADLAADTPGKRAVLRLILDDADRIGRKSDENTIGTSDKTIGAAYIEALAALSDAVVSMQPPVIDALKTYLEVGGNTGNAYHRSRNRLKQVWTMHDKGVLDWLTTSGKTEAGEATLRYLTKFIEKPLGSDMPPALEKLFEIMNDPAHPAGKVPHVWPAITGILAAAAKNPQKSSAFRLKDDGDPLGAFVWTLKQGRFRKRLTQIIADAEPDEAGFADRLAEEFAQGKLPLIAPDTKDFDELDDSIKAFAEDVFGAGAVTKEALTDELLAHLGVPDPEERAHFVEMAGLIRDNLGDDSDFKDFALKLDGAIDMVTKTEQSWGNAPSVSKLAYPDVLSFADVSYFIQHASAGDPAIMRQIIGALPLMARIMAVSGNRLGQRLFWQVKKIAHPTAGAVYPLRDPLGPVITMPGAATGSQVTDMQKSAMRAMVAIGEEVAERLGLVAQKEGKSISLTEPMPRPDELDPTRVSQEKDGVSQTQEIGTLRLPADATLDQFLAVLQAAYYSVNNTGKLTDKNAEIFFYLQEVRRIRAEGGDIDEAVGDAISIKTGQSNEGVISLYVGDTVVMSLKVPQDDASKQEKDEGLTATYSIGGGDNYAVLINKMLAAVIDGDDAGTVSGLFTSMLARLAPHLDGLPQDERIAKELALFRGIAAGSEFLRDPMAIPALMLTLYAFRGTGSAVHRGGTLYPSQSAFGHLFYRKFKINAFAVTGLSDSDKTSLKEAGFDPDKADTAVGVLKAILKRNREANQALGGGLFVPSIPLYLRHRLHARKIARDETTDLKPHAARLAHAILKRTDDLLGVAIQRYVIEKKAKGEEISESDIDSAKGRAAILREIVEQMMDEILPELAPHATDPGSDDEPR